MGIRILTITPALNLCGGIENYTMNYYRNMSNDIYMDFITHEIKDEQYKKEIEEKGGKVYLFSTIDFKNLGQFLRQLKEFFNNHHDYDIIHCNMANAAVFYFYYAKKYGINVRIIHSHQNNYADKFLHKLRNIPLIHLGKKLATHNFACSKYAGDFLFGKNNYYIINNAIDTEKFKYNENKRKEIRKKENLNEDELLFANIGRFCNQKNQLFLIDIFNLIHKENENTKLFLIGRGELKDKIKQKIKEDELEDCIVIKEPIKNVNEYLQAIDALVMPSLYEGLPVIGVEAQCADVKCFFSNAITQETKISNETIYIDLQNCAEEWKNIILKKLEKTERKDKTAELTQKGFNIKTESQKLEKLYIKLINETK